MASESAVPVPVAIIGMGCLFPKANDASRYWANIRDGIDAITEVPASHWRPEDYFDADPKAPDHTYARRGGFLDPYDFAPLDFGLSPNTLEATDTTQLLGLVAARQAMIDAGYGPDRTFDRSRVSVILGVTGTLELVIPLAARLGHPLWKKALDEAGVAKDVADDVVKRIASGYVGWQEDSFPGLLGNVVAGRISNRLDLGGTNCVVDAACASSLGAVHLALLELASGRADMVLTGGMDTFNDIFMYMCFSKTPALSPSGDARPFAAAADGTILGEGLGCLVLKRLEDAERDGDRVYAVIKAVGSSSDGKGQAIYAPSSEGQTRALRDAYARAGVTPESIELVEAHGTGTQAGDKAEAAALEQVYGAAGQPGSWCALGSVKSQIGHTKAAAGAAGLMKAALALHHKVLPPTIKVDRPIDILAGKASPFYVNTERRPWLPSEDHPRRAAVSAFGFGGSNYHCVLEEYRAETDEVDWDGDVQILSWSADSADDLSRAISAWPAGLAWNDLRRKAAETRAAFDHEQPHRLAIVAERRKGDVDKLIAQAGEVCRRRDDKATGPIPDGIFHQAGPAAGDLVLLFPGQGAQYPGMFLDLACRFPQMRQALTRANTAFDRDRDKERLSQRLSDYIYPRPAFDKEAKTRNEAALRATDVAQPALGAVAVGAVHILDFFGVKPAAVAGHSYGELPSLCAAGRFDVDTLHRLSRERGRSMAEGSGDRGAMLAVLAERHTIDEVLGEDKLTLVVANKNAPMQSVLSGASSEIDRARASFARRSIEAIPLSVSAAFHSSFVAEARERFSTALADVELHTSAIPVFANTTGRAYPADPAEARALLAGQLAEPVEFVSLIENMHESGYRTYLEVGPGSKLTGLVHSILKGRQHAAFSLDGSTGARPGAIDLARTLAALATLGHEVNLTKWDGDPDLTIPLPVRRPTLTVPLTGANYVKPKPAIPPAPKPPAPAARPIFPTESATVQPVHSNGSHVNGNHKNGDSSPLRVASNGNGHVNGSHRAEANPTGRPESRVSEKQASPASRQSLQTPRANLSETPLRQGLIALQELGEQTARLHKQFLEGQDRALQVLQSLLTHSDAPALMPQPKPDAMLAPAPAATPTPLARPAKAKAAAPAPAARKVSPVVVEPIPAPQPAAPALGTRAQETLLAVVAEKTGYPVEMLDLTMEIEADLGIDSIKRVEIFSAIQERLPEAPPIRAEHLGTLRSLRQVAEFLSGGATSQPANPPISAPPARSSSQSTLLAVVAEKTGYPVEMLDLAMEIEADLGIDSIKRVEIFSAIAERLPDAPAIRAEHLGTLRTLGQVAEFLDQNSGGPVPVQSPPIARTAEPTVVPVLLAVVAEKTGYPVEMLDLTMEIEADLGIDSIKRVEIFSTLQERLPDAPPIRAEHLGVLRTLGQVAEFLAGGNAQPARESQVKNTPVAAQPQVAPASRMDAIERFLVSPVPIDPANRRPAAALLAAGEVWINGADDPVIQAIERRLVSLGFRTRWIEQLPETLRAPADLAGLIVVASAGGIDDTFLRDALQLVKTASPGLRTAAVTGGACLLTVSRLDGSFGLGERGPASVESALSGGLAGLSKTAALEWPELRCRALDIDASIGDFDVISGWIVDELSHEGPVEVGYTSHSVVTLSTRKTGIEQSPVSVAPLAPGDVIVVSGGARGVTAEVAEVLGRTFAAKLALLGRSPAPNAEPAWLVDLKDESAIKRAWMSQQGKPVAPREVESAYRAIAANREALRNIDRMRGHGLEVVYHQVDVTDEAGVADAIGQIRRELGPVRAIVHGAGVLADALIEAKSLQSFDHVYKTKVHGLRALLSAVPTAGLKALVVFSSSTARFGRVGQVDYAMANEVMNKIADFEAQRSPDCRVLSVNWGPWDGGMVTPGLKKLFASEGVGVIPLAAGAEYLARELSMPSRSPVEVVILGTGGIAPIEPPRVSSSTEPLSFVCEREISRIAMPVLDSHVIDGRHVLPMAITLELLAHAALHGQPGLVLNGVDGLRINRGVIVDRDEQLSVRIYAGKPNRVDGQVHIATELRSRPSDREIVHARADIILGDRTSTTPRPSVELGLPSYRRALSSVYGDILFHGDALRGILDIVGCSPAGISARLAAAPAPKAWLTQPHRGSWITDPLVLDSIFQLMIVWSYERHGAASLPCFLGRYEQFTKALPKAGIVAKVRVTKDTPQHAVADVELIDDRGELVARIQGYECVIDANLNQAFRQNGKSG